MSRSWVVICEDTPEETIHWKGTRGYLDPKLRFELIWAVALEQSLGGQKESPTQSFPVQNYKRMPCQVTTISASSIRPQSGGRCSARLVSTSCTRDLSGKALEKVRALTSARGATSSSRRPVHVRGFSVPFSLFFSKGSSFFSAGASWALCRPQGGQWGSPFS